MRAFLAGVPGVGKSATLAAWRPEAPVIKFGVLMWNVAQAEGFQGSRDDLRTLSSKRLDELRQQVVSGLPAAFVLDGHLVIEENGFFRSAVPPELLRPHALTDVLVLEGTPTIIAGRRAGRQDRRSGDEAWIETHQARQREAAIALAQATTAQLRFIDTSSLSPDAVASNLRFLLGTEKGAL